MLMKLLITALAIGAAIGETDSSNFRGRELADTKKVCIYLGRKFGSQTFDVPSGELMKQFYHRLLAYYNLQDVCVTSYFQWHNLEKFRFYISSSRVFPAASGECDPDLVKNLSTEDLRIKKFCRLFKHTLNEYWTVDAISAATDWMLANEFEQGSCTNKNTYGTLHMEHLKEVNQNKFDDLYEELVDLMSNFTYEELVRSALAFFACFLHEAHKIHSFHCSWMLSMHSMIFGMEITPAIEELTDL
jgi:ribosomal protein L11